MLAETHDAPIAGALTAPRDWPFLDVARLPHRFGRAPVAPDADWIWRSLGLYRQSERDGPAESYWIVSLQVRKGRVIIPMIRTFSARGCGWPWWRDDFARLVRAMTAEMQAALQDLALDASSSAQREVR